MNASQIQEVFSAQTDNVRELERAWRHVNRDINTSYLKNQLSSVSYETKIMALVYCALAEAIFSKLIHTPHGFAPDHILQIKQSTKEHGIKSGWLKCLELALLRVEGRGSGHVPNVQRKLSAFIDAYIFDPSILRNKIAHGQWVKALNRENEAINRDITKEINDLTVVELYRRKNALEKLASILEDIIESPNKAHHRDYWQHLVDMEQEQAAMAGWTVERKLEQLRQKYERHKKIGITRCSS